MKQREENFLAMVGSTLGHLNLHPREWQNEGPIPGRVISVTNLFNEASGHGGQQRRSGNIFTIKDAELSRAAGLAAPMATRIRSFARVIADPLLLAAMDHNPSDLLYGPQDLRVGYMNDILDAAKTHATQLAAYKVRPADITALEDALTSAGGLREKAGDAKVHTTVATSRIPELIDQLRTELEALDDDVEAFIENEEFVAAYFIARRITDRRATHSTEAPAT
ncbi:MAG: hypothetical protein EOO16_23950 [Chitinophagaceae bacterium]|nr:MAG: hypothetical protein EOO16_23950 [Chitinophagaceae bacterium]